MSPPPLSLYVHLPWCVRKCPYCDFNSHTAGAAPPRQRYIDALLKDLRREAARAEGRTLISVFLGGGTPSLFSPQEIEQLLKGVRALFTLAGDIEITMEANPGTVECGAPEGYRAAGVNRLSIGAQSFDDALLLTLGRIHSSDDIARAFAAAKQGGFDNINIDLMHGLPGQSVEMAMTDLEAALALGPAHLSWYQLTLEPNTVFHARPPAGLPDEDLGFAIQDSGQALLAAAGFWQYEVSAYARNGHRCRHNLNYWEFGDYLAVGAGAHGKLTTSHGVERYQKPNNPLMYMQAQESAEPGAPGARLTEGDLLFEFMLNALRLNSGFDEAIFVERTGLSAERLRQASDRACKKGLIERRDSGIWTPTELGSRFLNDLLAEYLGAWTENSFMHKAETKP
jgi:putative oxygen-independent coproporphyrinogen III oxidase